MKRRNFLKSLLIAGVAPAIVKAENLMKVRPLESGLLVPEDFGMSVHDRYAKQIEKRIAEMKKDMESALISKYEARNEGGVLVGSVQIYESRWELITIK